MTPANRVGVSVRLRYPTDQFGFMVVDAGDSVLAGSELISRTLKRHEVIGTPLAAEVFSMLDAIWLRDERIAELA